VACAAIVVAFMPSAASAGVCGSDCHGVTRWFQATHNAGEIAYLTTSGLFVDNVCQQKAYNTSWEGTDDNTAFNTWVEEGIFVGYKYNGTCTNTQLQYYWAHMRPDGTYAEIDLTGTVDTSIRHSFKIEYAGNDQWAVFRDGNFIAYANNDPCCSYGMQAGAESHNGDSQLAENGEANGLQKEINASWSYGWTAAAPYSPEGFFTMGGLPHSDETYHHP